MMKAYFNTKIDGIGLSIFRMFYSIVLFLEIHQLYIFRAIIYDKETFGYKGELDVAFLFYFWFIVVLFLFFGLFTRISTIINYLFSVIIFSSAVAFEYHVFYAYVGINFLLMFIPIARVFSLDAVIQKIKYSTIGKPFQIDRKVLRFNYVMPVFVAIGLVYFDSIFHKISSKMWMDGLGVWLPSSLPMVVWNDTSIILNQKWLVLLLGYLVMVFEAVFIFLFWFKRFRIPFFLLGIFFHIGILIAYPIPYFALTAVAVYLLLVPVCFWYSIKKIITFRKSCYTFYYDAECPLCIKVVVVIQSLDVFKAISCETVQDNYEDNIHLKNISEEALLLNIHGVSRSGKVYVGYWAYVHLLKAMMYTFPIGILLTFPGVSYLGKRIYTYVAGNRLTERCTTGNCLLPVYIAPVSETNDYFIKGWNRLNFTRFFWYGLLIIMIFGQSLMIWFTPAVQNNFPKVTFFNKIISKPYNALGGFYLDYLGVTHHPVFMFDNHFKGYKIIFKIESVTVDGKHKLVPLLNENGLCENSYANGAFWVNYTFRVNSPRFDLKVFEKGIIPYLKFYKNNENNDVEKYVLYSKEIQPKEKWEKDFLHKQIAKPWIKVGSCKIQNDSTIFEWNDKMKEILELEREIN